MGSISSSTFSSCTSRVGLAGFAGDEIVIRGLGPKNSALELKNLEGRRKRRGAVLSVRFVERRIGQAGIEGASRLLAWM